MLVLAHHPGLSPQRLGQLRAAQAGEGASPSPSCIACDPAASQHFMNIKTFGQG